MVPTGLSGPTKRSDKCPAHAEPASRPAAGARRWVQRLVIRGRSRGLGLGSYALVSLAEARELALANRSSAAGAMSAWPREGDGRLRENRYPSPSPSSLTRKVLSARATRSPPQSTCFRILAEGIRAISNPSTPRGRSRSRTSADARLEVGAVCLQAGVRVPGVDGGAVRLATSVEIDTAGRVWTMPVIRMKAKREHRVTLCGRAVEILNAAHTLGDDNRLDAHWRLGRSSTATVHISKGQRQEESPLRLRHPDIDVATPPPATRLAAGHPGACPGSGERQGAVLECRCGRSRRHSRWLCRIPRRSTSATTRRSFRRVHGGARQAQGMRRQDRRGARPRRAADRLAGCGP